MLGIKKTSERSEGGERGRESERVRRGGERGLGGANSHSTGRYSPR